MPYLFSPDGGINRKIKTLYMPDGGVNRKVKSLWAADQGINRKIFNYLHATALITYSGPKAYGYISPTGAVYIYFNLDGKDQVSGEWEIKYNFDKPLLYKSGDPLFEYKTTISLYSFNISAVGVQVRDESNNRLLYSNYTQDLDTGNLNFEESATVQPGITADTTNSISVWQRARLDSLQFDDDDATIRFCSSATKILGESLTDIEVL